MRVLIYTLVFACVPHPKVAPTKAGPLESQAPDGVSIAVEDRAWDGEPGNLPQYATPYAVTITNHGASPVYVDLADFALQTDQVDEMYALRPSRGPEDQIAHAEAPDPAEYPVGAMSVIGPRPTAIFKLYPTTERFMWRTELGRYKVNVGLRRYFAGTVPNIPEPSRFYYIALPPAYDDVRENGIKEGPLAAGQSISGFVYFPRFKDEGEFRLVWTPRSVDHDEALTQLNVRLYLSSR